MLAATLNPEFGSFDSKERFIVNLVNLNTQITIYY